MEYVHYIKGFFKCLELRLMWNIYARIFILFCPYWGMVWLDAVKPLLDAAKPWLDTEPWLDAVNHE